MNISITSVILMLFYTIAASNLTSVSRRKLCLTLQVENTRSTSSVLREVVGTYHDCLKACAAEEHCTVINHRKDGETYHCELTTPELSCSGIPVESGWVMKQYDACTGSPPVVLSNGE